MFLAMIVPAALFFIVGFFLPESPRWLATVGRRDTALQVFDRIGGRLFFLNNLFLMDSCLTWKGIRGMSEEYSGISCAEDGIQNHVSRLVLDALQHEINIPQAHEPE